MLTINTDYQSATPDGELYIFKCNGLDLDEHAEELGLTKGEIVWVDDPWAEWKFKGILDFRFRAWEGKEIWVVDVDWNSGVRKPDDEIEQ